MSEFERSRLNREHELRNGEVIERILVSGSDSEMGELRDLYGLTAEQMNSMCYWARLRHETKAGTPPLENREETFEEKDLGIRIESIEPQVLDAVRTFRKKGYTTTFSGFAHFGSQQTIWFAQERTITLPETERLAIESRWGVKIRTESGSIWIDCLEARLNIEELKQMWNSVADMIPEYKPDASLDADIT